MLCCILLGFLAPFFIQVDALYDPDEVTYLPGLSFKPNFRQWSGYLQASPGKYLHYWFVTSQRDPEKDPLVLWLNGGPGCSSLDGFLSENGPFYVSEDGVNLYMNPYSWNKIANVLYLESPVGVGFSYSDDKNYSTNDDEVAENNYKALQSFFNKFPNFTLNDFFIFGESYGGIYVPTLSMKIVTGSSKINFKGFGVGNGLSSYDLNDQSAIYFGYYHGLFGDELWANLNKYCCKDGICIFYNSTVKECMDSVMQGFSILYDSGLNMYALYLDCAGGVGPYIRYIRDMENLFRNYKSYWTKKQANEKRLKLIPPCINATAQTNWLNRGDVQKALHIPDVLPPWELCSDTVGSQYVINYTTMGDFYLKLLAKGLRVLVYNGDTDLTCNFLGDQWFVEGLDLKETTKYQVWLYDKQIAGYYQQFGNITFLTVKGAGHMVPQWAPGPALKMFQSFLTNSPY
ncbi:cathepsin A-like [Erpetoichthys calabaricus]|uniref:cathepsin A-like n=1 Tax=Erpetoichthys calabaricus TaxID=27687 RepID=UPI00223481D4|nr:cathepsin A-like [Erpetoichthys calabaricus]